MTQEVIIALIGVLVAGVTGFFLYLKSRSDSSAPELTAKSQLDKLIDERVEKQLKSAWSRIDELETHYKDLEHRETRRTQAITRILRAIAKQWPNENGPDLDPADIAEIEETIPPAWIRKSPV